MIVGIGNDIIEIERVEKAISKEGFIAKVYTQREIENIVKRGNRAETYAGIFSAKEAISKAIGTGVREFSLTDLEILNDDLGKPYVIVSDKLKGQGIAGKLLDVAVDYARKNNFKVHPVCSYVVKKFESGNYDDIKI